MAAGLSLLGAQGAGHEHHGRDAGSPTIYGHQTSLSLVGAALKDNAPGGDESAAFAVKLSIVTTTEGQGLDADVMKNAALALSRAARVSITHLAPTRRHQRNYR
jgi:hypothetical protein